MGDRLRRGARGFPTGELCNSTRPTGVPLSLFLVEGHPVETSAPTFAAVSDPRAGRTYDDRVHGKQPASGSFG